MRLRGRLSRLTGPDPSGRSEDVPAGRPVVEDMEAEGANEPLEPGSRRRFGDPLEQEDLAETILDGELPPSRFVEAVEEHEAAPHTRRHALEAPVRTPSLADLRARMERMLAHAPVERGARPPPLVDLPELPFVTEETALGPLHVRARRLSAAHRVGHIGLQPARTARPEVLALLALDAGLAGCSPERALYLDTETTGLSGGTGTVAFLVGLAFWDEGWIVEQLLVRELGEEAPMLARVAERLAAAEMIVTFNGKSFDMPLLRTRFVLAGLPLPPEPPHLDLVHVARRLHKARGVPCKLTKLEEHVLGFERVDDVPSGEVAGHYLHFLRTGDTRGLVGVVDHNGWDVETMIAMVALYGEPLDETRLIAKDLVGIARTLRRSDRMSEALLFAERAVAEGAGPEGLRERAELKKARGDREAALLDFETLASQVDCAKTRLELVKLYEHVRRAPAQALEVLSRGTKEAPAMAEKRRARLELKVAKDRAKDAKVLADRTDHGPLFGTSGALRRG